MHANILAALLACVRVLAALSCSEAFQVSAMLDAAMHLVDDGFLRFSDDPLDLVSKGCKRSLRAPPFTAFQAAIAACFTTISFSVGRDALSAKSIALRRSAILTPKRVLATEFSTLCVATSSPVWGCSGFRRARRVTHALHWTFPMTSDLAIVDNSLPLDILVAKRRTTPALRRRSISIVA